MAQRKFRELRICARADGYDTVGHYTVRITPIVITRLSSRDKIKANRVNARYASFSR